MPRKSFSCCDGVSLSECLFIIKVYYYYDSVSSSSYYSVLVALSSFLTAGLPKSISLSPLGSVGPEV